MRKISNIPLRGSAAVLRTSIRRTSAEVAGRAEQLSKVLCKARRRRLPPRRRARLCRKPFPSTNIYQHRPTLTAPSHHFWHSKAALGATHGPQMSHKCPPRAPSSLQESQLDRKSPSRWPFGAPPAVPSLRKHQKHTGISMFSRCPQNRILSTSGHSFCSPGPQKGAPERPRGAPRTPKPPILKPHFTHFSQLFPLRPQVRSQGLPNWPSQTQNDPKDALQASKIYQNSLKNPTPHTKD